MRESFILYTKYERQIRSLSMEQRGVLFTAILSYEADADLPEMDAATSMAFDFIRVDLEENQRKYEVRRGKNHWNWKGGISDANHRIRTSSEYSRWRKNVFARDDFTCQLCGNIGGKLNAHHIKRFADYPELRFDVNNGVTLCEKCHRKVHHGER